MLGGDIVMAGSGSMRCSPENSGSHATLRWRETDSNHRSLATSPSLSHAQIDVAARHYEGHALEHRHVVKRARIHSDHIGRFA